MKIPHYNIIIEDKKLFPISSTLPTEKEPPVTKWLKYQVRSLTDSTPMDQTRIDDFYNNKYLGLTYKILNYKTRKGKRTIAKSFN